MARKKQKENQTTGTGLNGLLKELWEAAVALRGTIEPAIISAMSCQSSFSASFRFDTRSVAPS